jgi:hypothetical protein
VALERYSLPQRSPRVLGVVDAGLPLRCARGKDAGGHARVSPGVHALPFNLPTIVEATVELD